ncbi:hypothetical protein PoB_003990500 [Plakobranchus ocellatus]|uniref:Uncharacterized protein n=1 Tax=Plakobranchus ocellatus TaxID=259542 RepID=A0AAV4B1E1_9GAST|nr:hypothetical protein PoB_003990500 [Plakobranchus ocellatus]
MVRRGVVIYVSEGRIDYQWDEILIRFARSKQGISNSDKSVLTLQCCPLSIGGQNELGIASTVGGLVLLQHLAPVQNSSVKICQHMMTVPI